MMPWQKGEAITIPGSFVLKLPIGELRICDRYGEWSIWFPCEINGQGQKAFALPLSTPLEEVQLRALRMLSDSIGASLPILREAAQAVDVGDAPERERQAC